MTYYLQDYPPYDRKSFYRILLGIITLISCLTVVFRLTFLGIGPIEFVIGVGVPVSFALTFIVMGIISSIFFPKERSDLSLELSKEKIVLKKAGTTTVLKNENLKIRYPHHDSIDFFVTDETGAELHLDPLVIPNPDHHLRIPRHTILNLVHERGKIYLEGRQGLKTWRFPFD